MLPLAISALAFSCATPLSYHYRWSSGLAALLESYSPSYPEASFAVISDIHYHDPSLGVSGTAFEECLDRDRKLIRESREIAEAAFAAVEKESLDFVIIPGDLTKDGEYDNHLAVAALCARLRESGKKVFVAPGNHDVKNGLSYRYTGDGRERVRNVTPAGFADIYADCGYRDALFRDPNSLSYVAEPVPGLRLLALDSCRYAENEENRAAIVGGRFEAETLVWIEDVLERAARNGKAVIAMMHHGILEHFPSQAKYFNSYVIERYEQISRMLADYKVRAVFTGHFHAQDIAAVRWDDRTFLFDVETGSLASYPCPYRFVRLSGGALSIASHRVDSIPSRPEGFREYAKEFIAGGVAGVASAMMRRYGVPESDIALISQQLADAMTAHFAGDERLPPGREAVTTAGLSLLGSVALGSRASLVEGVWNDSPCPDNDVVIDLAIGAWR